MSSDQLCCHRIVSGMDAVDREELIGLMAEAIPPFAHGAAA
jgi:hypothetical protein